MSGVRPGAVDGRRCAIRAVASAVLVMALLSLSACSSEEKGTGPVPTPLATTQTSATAPAGSPTPPSAAAVVVPGGTVTRTATSAPATVAVTTDAGGSVTVVVRAVQTYIQTSAGGANWVGNVTGFDVQNRELVAKTNLSNNDDGKTKARAMCTVVAQAVSAGENLGITVTGIRVLDAQGASLATRSGSGSCQ